MSFNEISRVKKSIIEPYRSRYSTKKIITECDLGIIKSCYDFNQDPFFAFKEKYISNSLFKETQSQIVKELCELEQESKKPLNQIVKEYLENKNQLKLIDFIVSSEELSFVEQDTFIENYIQQNRILKNELLWFCNIFPKLEYEIKNYCYRL
jgi:hypothetical protein